MAKITVNIRSTELIAINREKTRTETEAGPRAKMDSYLATRNSKPIQVFA